MWVEVGIYPWTSETLDEPWEECLCPGFPLRPHLECLFHVKIRAGTSGSQQGRGCHIQSPGIQEKRKPRGLKAGLSVHGRAGVRVTVTLGGLYVGSQRVSGCDPRREHDPSEAGSCQFLREQEETKRHHPGHQNVSSSEVKETTLTWLCSPLGEPVPHWRWYVPGASLSGPRKGLHPSKMPRRIHGWNLSPLDHCNKTPQAGHLQATNIYYLWS